MLERDKTVDILKGIGILCVVSGHASSGAAFYPFAPYSFHMPLFFFISGMFFNERAKSKASSILIKNIKSLLLYSTIFYVFYAIICQIIGLFGFSYFPEPITLDGVFVNQFMGSGAYKFTSAYWFIPCLFFVKIYFSLFHNFIVRFISSLSVKEYSVCALFLAIYLLIGFFCVVYSVDMYSENAVSWSVIPLYRFGFALQFYYIGFLFKKYNASRYIKNIAIIFILYVIQQQLWAASGNLDFWMQASKYQSTISPLFSSVISILFFYSLSEILSKNESCVRTLGYIGERSLSIVLHHLFGFFVLNTILCMMGIITPSDVNNQYFQWNTTHTWYLYIIFGIAVSLFFDKYLDLPTLLRLHNNRPIQK